MSFVSLWVSLGFMAFASVGPRTGTGDLAADFKLKNFSGQDVRLSQYRGKVVLLDFWATWCTPCERALPELFALWKKYREEGLVFLAVNIDNKPTNAAKFLRDHQIDMDFLWDGRKRVVSSYAVRKMPTAYLIDRFGILRYVSEGFSEKDIDKMEQEVRTLLNDKATADLVHP